MSSVTVIPITQPMMLGEGPHWIEKNQSLIFVDHPAGTVNRYYTETGRLQVLKIEGATKDVGPSAIIPVESNDEKFIIPFGHDITVVDWSSNDSDLQTTKPVTLCSFDVDHPTNSLNDAKVDPSGRLWAGTKGYECDGKLDEKKGSLYRINCDLKISQHVEKVTLSNGLTWSNDHKTFFYIDTPTLCVDAFDYNDQEGKISNRRTVFDCKMTNLQNQYPDGMTMDLNGNLWIAFYNGGKVLNIDPQTGVVLRKISIPSKYTTSCSFGGADYSTLYVTTATRGMSAEELKRSPDSGKTFAVTGLGVKGSPHRNFRLEHSTLDKKLQEAS